MGTLVRKFLISLNSVCSGVRGRSEDFFPIVPYAATLPSNWWPTGWRSSPLRLCDGVILVEKQFCSFEFKLSSQYFAHWFTDKILRWAWHLNSGGQIQCATTESFSAIFYGRQNCCCSRLHVLQPLSGTHPCPSFLCRHLHTVDFCTDNIFWCAGVWALLTRSCTSTVSTAQIEETKVMEKTVAIKISFMVCSPLLHHKCSNRLKHHFTRGSSRCSGL